MNNDQIDCKASGVEQNQSFIYSCAIPSPPQHSINSQTCQDHAIAYPCSSSISNLSNTTKNKTVFSQVKRIDLVQLFFEEYLNFFHFFYLACFNFSVLLSIFNLIAMSVSSKKIVRLKSVTKLKQSPKSAEQTMATNIYCNQLSTIMKVENIEPSQRLQAILINEINKLYRDIDVLKKQIAEYKQINEELTNDKKKAKSKIQLIEKQQLMFKSMYELERENHERLRKFYEHREQQWIEIIEQQRKILQEYQISNQTALSLKSQKSLEGLSISSHQYFAQTKQQPDCQKVEQLKVQSKIEQRGERRLVRRISHKNCISEPKQIFIEERDSGVERRRETKNFQADDILDLIFRKIYHQNKQKQISIADIARSEDMVKLKKAKTSTRERLIKTLKKFCHHQNINQIMIFCDSVEQQVINQHKMLLGELVYIFLIQRLRQCQKLALSSNSMIDRANSYIADRPRKQIESKDKLVKGNRLDDNKECQQQRYSLLQLNSITKIAKVQSVEKEEMHDGNEQQIRYSISSLRNLSELINGDTAYLLDETDSMEANH